MSRGCWSVGPAAPLACDRNTSCEVQHELCGLNEVAETVWRTGVEVTGNVCFSRGGHERCNGNMMEGFKAFEPGRAWFRSKSETSNALNPNRTEERAEREV